MRSLLAFWFRMAVKFRHFLYRKGIFKAKKASIPVISIGSIQMGGSGKTPLCIYLAKFLSQNQVNFGFVSRGYRSKAEKLKQPILMDHQDAALFGDEPSLIYSHFNDRPFAVGKRRGLGVDLIEQQGATVALLDDGFQHLSLKKDLQIITLHAQDPFSGGAFFPKGRLRDEPKRLQEADLIVAYGEEETLKEKLQEFTRAPIVHAVKRFLGAFDQSGKRIEYGDQKIALFAGIAHPASFFAHFDEAQVVLKKSLRDHQKISKHFLSTFVKKAKKAGAKYIFCTQKDWVRIQDFSLDPALGYIEMEIEIVQGEEILKRVALKSLGLEKKNFSRQDRKDHVKI